MTAWDRMAVVGRVARTHGLRGEVVVSPETDFLEDRFAIGASMWTRAGSGDEQLTVRSVRLRPRLVVGFEGFSRVDDAARLVGSELRIEEAELQPLPEGSYYQHELIGCVVEGPAGAEVGTVRKVEDGGGSVCLVVAGVRGEVLIPLTTAICTTIDVAGRRIEIAPPEGLLELNEVRHRHHLPEDDRSLSSRGRRRSRG